MNVPRSAGYLLLVAATLVLWMGLTAVATQEPPLNLKVQGLVERLADPSAEERREAREELLTLGAAAVPPLILATESVSALLRWESVNLLGTLGDLRATNAVLRVAMTDSDVHARWRANWAITNLEDGTVIPQLVEGLADDDPFVAWNSAITLSMFGSQEALPILHAGLSASGWQQWEAVNALGRVWSDDTASKLIVVLQGGAEDVRKEAALTLGRIGGGEVLAALLGALADDPSSEVRWRAAMMIAYIGDSETAVLLANLRVLEADAFVIEHIDEAIAALSSIKAPD